MMPIGHALIFMAFAFLLGILIGKGFGSGSTTITVNQKPPDDFNNADWWKRGDPPPY